MTFSEIELRSDIANYEFSIDIDDEIYFLKIMYNFRAGLWVLNLYDAEKVIILSGIPLQTGVDLIGIYRYESLFRKAIFLIDKLNLQRNADRDILGDQVIMLVEN